MGPAMVHDNRPVEYGRTISHAGPGVFLGRYEVVPLRGWIGSEVAGPGYRIYREG